MPQQQKGFLPYILVVFLNAFVDLGHKIVIQNTIFKHYDGQAQVILTAVINGLILLPFILLFSPAGFLSDRFAKERIIRYSALFAIAATLAITFAYYQGWFWAAFGLTLILAVQSAIYSPAKYGYIKELVGGENLASANGAVQAVTIAGILLGTFVFSLLFEGLLPDSGLADPGTSMRHIAPIGWVLVGLAVMEWGVTALLPARRPGSSATRFELRPYLRLQYLRRNLTLLGENSTIWLSIIGLATFWAISQVMLAAFPAFAKESLDITNTVVIQGILACSGVGIVVGSLIAGRASQHYIETGLIPVGALGIALGIALLPGLDSATGMGVTFLLVGVMGGLFIVPLNSLIQFQAGEEQMGTVLAGNNWIQNVVMLAALCLAVFFAMAGIDSVGLFYILTLVAVIGTGYTVRKLPHSLARILVTMILKRRYRIEVIGFDNLPRSGAALLLGNHISWIDWALVQIACPRPLRFVMLRRIYETWYLKPFFKAFGVVPIESGRSEDSLQTINALLRAGECVCLFPEGAISRNGQLGKFHTGYERAVEGVEEGVILPFYLHGLWGSSLSRADEGLRYARAPGLRRDLIVAFGEPLPLDTGAKQLKQKVFDLSLMAWQSHTRKLDPVPLAWLRAARRRGSGISLTDSGGGRLTHLQLVARVAGVSSVVKQQCKGGRVGMLLPPSMDAAVATLALLMQGRVVVPLNYSLDEEALAGIIHETGIKEVLTTRGFHEEVSAGLGCALEGLDLHFVGEVDRAVPPWRRMCSLLAAGLLPPAWYYRLHGQPTDIEAAAAVLYTRGHQGRVKGVVLSHRNLMANCRQMSDVLNTRVDDVMMSCLPPFHALGLTVTMLMPLVEGIPMVCHPDPQDAPGIARAIARSRATILVGTSSLFSLYPDDVTIHPLMLASLRVVVAGAERLDEEVRRRFELRFGKAVYEGYGTTETAPVVCVNVPDAIDTSDWKIQQGNLPGTVGLPLPGTSVRIVDPVRLEPVPLGQEGLILVSGSQVMRGYLGDEEASAGAILELDGLRWFCSGDRGHLTEEGFLVLAA